MNPRTPQLLPTSKIAPHDRARLAATVCDTISAARRPRTPQNATVCNTVASVASATKQQDATLCNTVASAASRPERQDATGCNTVASARPPWTVPRSCATPREKAVLPPAPHLENPPLQARRVVRKAQFG
jgi:hypothetical protein